MKTRQFCLLLCVMMSVSMFAQKQSYEKMWKSVEASQKKDLPRTALKITDDIFRKALLEKNSPQMLKAYLYQVNTKVTIDADSFYVNLKGLEKWEAESKIPMDKAILNSIIAQLYADYAQNNSWQLLKGKQLVGDAPEDIREWSLNLFIQKSFSYLRLSLKDQSLLQETSSSTYEPIVLKGETSDYFHHDMFHLLAKRALSILSSLEPLSKNSYLQSKINAGLAFSNTADFLKTQISAASEYDVTAENLHIYQNLLSYYQAKGYKEAVLLTEIERLKFLNGQFAQTNADEWQAIQEVGIDHNLYIVALNHLINQNSSSDVCAEVYLEKANDIQSKGNLPLALQILDEAIEKYPKYKRINALKSQKEQLLNPSLNVKSSKVIYPGETFDLTVSHKNLDGFKINLYKVNLPVTSSKLNNYPDKEDYKKDIQLFTTEHYSLIKPVDFQQKDTVFKVKAPAFGIYLLNIVPDANVIKTQSQFIFSSAIKVLIRSLSGKKIEIITLDAQSGQPIPDATVTLFVNNKGEKKEHSKVTTNKNGSVVIDNVDNLIGLTASKGNDVALPVQNFNANRYSFVEVKEDQERVTLLTDRSLYRPGQTVFVKGIAYRSASDTANVVANKEYILQLYDANYKMIAEKKLLTNEFGSFTTDFSLPASTLNGQFQLKTTFGSTNIRVEEYKRPTFELTFQPLEGSYTFNDSVRVKGMAKTFSGVPVQGSSVKYTITRAARNWWRWNNDNEVTLTSGEAAVDATGNFEVPVQLVPDLSDRDDESYYIYKVKATLTDAAGETQTAENSLAVGSCSLILSSDLADEVCRDKAITTIFSADNLNQKPVNVEGTYQLFKKGGKEPVLSGSFTSNKSQELPVWRELPSGMYKLVLSAMDEKGRKATYEKELILFSVNDRVPPVSKPIWCKLMDTTFAPGKSATILFGSGEKDVHVLYDVFADGKRIESRRLSLSNSVQRFDFPYKEAYGDGVFVNFCFVKNGTIYQQGERIEKALPDKKLTLKWEVFRDKLKPGQKEEWKLTIKDAKESAVKAEFFAAMYDASLDKIWKGNQGLNLNYERIIPTISWNSAYLPENYYYFNFPSKAYVYKWLSYDELLRAYINGDLDGGQALNEVAVIGYGTKAKGLRIRGASNGIIHSQESLQMSKVAISIADVKGNDSMANSTTPQQDIADSKEQTLDSTVPVRENFNETAFFYPQLRTNEKGEINFSFTMPESLTRWKFKGIAHTKDLLTGTLEGETVTSKDFMLSPNMPRFVRVGDRSSISARIINVSQKDIAGEVKMQLFDPATEKVILTKKQSFLVKAGQTSSASFEFTADANYSLLGCRLVADGGTFSDGEQHLLPVLSNKERIIETVAMPIRGNQTREFSLKDLFNGNSKTATDRKLTVEFTGNPAWYAVQSLPSLSNPTNENAVSWATAFYANSLASSIMNAQPRLKLVFEQWKAQGVTKETLWSNLQKNQEVKNILLEESPWLTEATNEAEQKQRLTVLFDLNTIQYKNAQALAKLKELQLSSGAWTWYKGMNGSRNITQFVLETMGRLSKLTGEPLSGDALTMQQAAFNYLHKEMLQKYKEIKKNEKKLGTTLGLDDESLHYLYLCALTGEKIPSVNKEAYTYYLSKVHQTLLNQTLMGKALSTIILEKAGKHTEAKDFLNSMKEYAVKTDEMGMFYASSVNPYSWFGNKMKIQTAILEAFDEVAKDSATVEEMKMWLLKQKQTQSWDSPIATVDAVYALLKRGSNLLDNPGDVRISLGKQVMETSSPDRISEPSIGYIKNSFEGEAITALNQIKVEKRDSGIAWGAVYAQYMEETEKVKQQGNELNISKALYVEHMVNNVKELQLLSSNETPLKVGDKVVSRITIRVDRDMDFVQLKDQRAACFEPLESISGYRWGVGTGYYVAVKDASTNFFFDSLSKGTYVLEHSFFVTRAGSYSSGIATLQSAYAPEFASHSSSERVIVE